MKFKVPKKKQQEMVLFRIPADIKDEFNKLMKETNTSGQQLVHQMVRFCLENRTK